MKISKEIRVRFAPSPTGYLHIGGARVAIFNWLFAKANNGKFLLRIEDTDKERSLQKYSEANNASLKWLGLDWDEPFVVQSEQIDKHILIINKLLEEKKAYRCFCSSSTLNELREESVGVAFKYPNHCRDKVFSESTQKNASFVIRLKLPELEKELIFKDLIKGEIKIESSVLDDFIIVKSNGIPTYNFAVVADDIDMKISHVIRGEDHLINTFKQMVLYDLIGAEKPFFGHLPMIMSSSGERLSKRFGAVSVNEYEEQGFLPDAMFNYLVRLGWSHGNQEIFSKEELINCFSLENVGVKNGIFDVDKLIWLNSHYIKLLNYEKFLMNLPSSAEELKDYLSQPFRYEMMNELFELYKNRATTIITLAQTLKRIEANWENFDKAKIHQELSFTTINLLKKFLKSIVYGDKFTATHFQELFKEFMNVEKIVIQDLAKPLRFVLIGEKEGPSVFALLEIFGKEYIKTLLEEL